MYEHLFFVSRIMNLVVAGLGMLVLSSVAKGEEGSHRIQCEEKYDKPLISGSEHRGEPRADAH